MSPKPAFISFDRPASHPASPEGLVLFDFAPGQVWKNATGTFIVGIQEKTPSGRFVIYTKDTDVIEAHQQPLDTEALIAFIKAKECLVKSEASLPAKKSPGEKPVTEPAPSKVVADMNEAREQRGMDPIPVGLEQQNALFSDIERLTNEIVSALEGINSKLKAVSEILEGVEENESVDTIKIQVLEISQRAGALLEEDDVADVAQKGKVFTQEYVDAKRERLEGIKVILTQAEDLSEGVRAAVTEMSAQTEVTMAASGESGAVTTGSGESVPAEKKKKPVRKGTGGGGDGTEDDGTSEKPKASKPKRVKRPLSDIVPEPSVVPMGAGVVTEGDDRNKDKSKGPEDFGGVIERLQAEVVAIVRGIKTPKGYAAFRDRMLKLKSPEESRPPVRHFFHLDTIRKEAGIPQQQMFSPEEEKQIRELEKNLEQAARNKFQELVAADFHGQYDREQAKIDSAKNEGDLSQQPNVDFVWEGVLSALTEWEQKRVSGEYQECLDRLNENFRKKRNYLRGALAENSGVKKTPREEAKEPSNEEQFASLVRVLRDGKAISFRKGANGKELVIESITDAEIKYNDGGKLSKTVTPRYVKGFLKFLREEFSWSLREGWRDGAKEQPDETAPKVEKIEEKTFEVLAEMLSARKKKQCVSVVSEGLAPLGQYAESQGLSLRSIVESMGIEKTAEGLVASLDDILPSEWGKEERSRFALQFAQREIEESLE